MTDRTEHACAHALQLVARVFFAQSEYLELMMISVAQLCHSFIPPMRTRGFGRVINVSSFAGRIAQPAGANYGKAKAYLVALSEELALELRSTGVHVSALCPCFIWYDAETVVRSGRLYRWLDPIAQSVWLRPIIKALVPER